MEHPKPISGQHRWRRFLTVLGPGLVVMLADTDAGSLVTAAQSGAQWGYQLLPLQFLLIPVLFLTQELTVRLGLITGKGLATLIRDAFGMRFAMLAVFTLSIVCLGALLTEFSGIAGVGLLLGVPAWASMVLAGFALILMLWSGSYRKVELTAAAIGSFELVFIYIAWQSHPQLESMLATLRNPPFSDHEFQYLIAANIGAVIMPWMIFYQQSAVVDKALTARDLAASRWDTLIGAVLTQLVMCSLLILVATGAKGNQAALGSIQEISASAEQFLGAATGRALFALGMGGAAMIGAIVVSLTMAWSVGELFGFKHSLDHHPREAPWFYGVFTTAVVVAALVVASGINLVRLSIAVEVMNALLLPLALGLLFLLARFALPDSHRIKGPYSILIASILLITSGMGLYGGLSGIFG